MLKSLAARVSRFWKESREDWQESTELSLRWERAPIQDSEAKVRLSRLGARLQAGLALDDYDFEQTAEVIDLCVYFRQHTTQGARSYWRGLLRLVIDSVWPWRARQVVARAQTWPAQTPPTIDCGVRTLQEWGATIAELAPVITNQSLRNSPQAMGARVRLRRFHESPGLEDCCVDEPTDPSETLMRLSTYIDEALAGDYRNHNYGLGFVGAIASALAFVTILASLSQDSAIDATESVGAMGAFSSFTTASFALGLLALIGTAHIRLKIEYRLNHWSLVDAQTLSRGIGALATLSGILIGFAGTAGLTLPAAFVSTISLTITLLCFVTSQHLVSVAHCRLDSRSDSYGEAD